MTKLVLIIVLSLGATLIVPMGDSAGGMLSRVIFIVLIIAGVVSVLPE